MKRWHIFLILIIVNLIYFSIWFITPKKILPLLLLDKTVPEPNYREHEAVFWLTKHWRMTDFKNDFRLHDQDYVGYHPETDRKDLLKKEYLEDIKLLYLADTYGIYNYENSLQDYELRLPYELIDIDLIFGGINTEEATIIKNFSKCENNVLVGEHNIFGYPTYNYHESSQIIQEIFGVKYNGWLVRYYEELKDVAYWVKIIYEKVYGVELNLTGPGLVLVREGGGRDQKNWYEDIVIFQEEDLVKQYPTIHIEKKHPLTKGASKKIPYLYWIEILDVEEDAEVLAYYEFPLTEKAKEKLKIRGINTGIPAIIYYEVAGEATRIYFAGDFTDQLPAFLPSWLTGSGQIQRSLSYLPGMPPQYSFYFRLYAPVLKNIINLIYQ